jgi:hypothetical protein
LEYNIPLFRDSSVTSFFEVSREVSRDKDISGRCKDVSERVNTGKTEGKSTVSESFKPKSFKSSSTFRDKLSSLNHTVVPSGGTSVEFPRGFYNRLRTTCLNLLSWIKTLALNLWHDRSGNIALVKKSKTSWKSKGGFQVSENQIQTRLVKHTYPCKHKIPVFCTEHKKTKYICRLTIDPYKDHLGYLKFYKDRLYCFCADYGDDLCWLHDYICFNNMLRREDCIWSRSKWQEEWIFETNLRKRMKNEMILEKMNENKTITVKTQ